MKLFLTCLIMAVLASFSLHAQHVGVGTNNPQEFFSVGASSQFRVNANGDLVRINNVQYSFPASNSSGTLVNNGSGTLSWTNSPALAVTNFTGTLPALNGSNLTSLNASNIASGTVPTARLGSGTADATTFLRGDGSWQPPAGGGGGITQILDTSISVNIATNTSNFVICSFNATNISNGVFTPPSNGIYAISVVVQMSASTTRTGQMRKNSTVIMSGLGGGGTGGGTNPSQGLHTIVNLTTSDNVTLYEAGTSAVSAMTNVSVRIYKLQD